LERKGGQHGKKIFETNLENCFLAIQKSIGMDEELFTKVIYD
jgi:hypothetical protein|tara:strand:+ start:73 stop:198 length:126 start_codon:yes stop_codon:yes gene_type:complete